MTILPQRRRIYWRGFFLRWTIIVALLLGFIAFMVAMPGKSYRGPLPPLSSAEAEMSGNLKSHVSALAGRIGPRNMIQYIALQEAGHYIEGSLKLLGYQVGSQEYAIEGRTARNLITEIRGGERAGEIVVVGAHYDTVFDSPGADDNASGVAALLELARILKTQHPARTLRLVAFVNEEPPSFQSANMGSWVYAKQARKLGENIVAAVSIETIGMYSDVEDSQHYPAGFSYFFPSRGNFIGFVGNVRSQPLVREMIRAFRETTAFPSEGVAAPEWIAGIGWSDQWSFWQEGYQGVMVTDTAPFRNPNYHLQSDTPETLDYDRMARVVQGLVKVVARLGR
jgi:hypothetical protein